MSLSLNSELFFDTLITATSGFYFLDADGEKDMGLMCGIDYRNSQPKGICLILACTFKKKSEYLQALGRVKRGTDDGQIWELQEPMWHDGE